jgi:hypothetical protein
MRIGTAKEIKTLEFRVGLTPEGARELCGDAISPSGRCPPLGARLI